MRSGASFRLPYSGAALAILFSFLQARSSAIAQTNPAQLQGGVAYQAGPNGPSCSQPETDTEHQRNLKALAGYLQTAEDELAKVQASGMAVSPIWQAQVDTRKLQIKAENAYYACKTRRIAKGCQPNAASLERDCRLCQGAVVIEGNRNLGRPSGAPPGFAPDMSVCGSNESPNMTNPECPTGTPQQDSSGGWFCPPAEANEADQCSPAQLEQISDWHQREVQRLLCFHWYPQSRDYIAAHRLPYLEPGQITAIATWNLAYNCYGYAAAFGHKPLGWVFMRTSQQPEPPAGSHPIFIASFADLISLFERSGWGTALPFNEERMQQEGGTWAVIYETSDKQPQHAAVWTSGGVYAKMGDLGLFRFGNLEQMEAPKYFGQPAVMMKLIR